MAYTSAGARDNLRPLLTQLQENRAGLSYWLKEPPMKNKKQKNREKATEQPRPFTPGITAGMVREHAYRMFRDKLPEHPLTLEDWVLAEKDLVNSMEAEDVQT